MRDFLFALLLTVPAMAQAQTSLPLAELITSTHIHGIAPGQAGRDSVTLATHHGLFALDLATGTARPLGESRDDFMGYTAVPGQPQQAFASGHPMAGGNLGILRSQDGGQTWQHVSDGLGGPVDFHNMEVSRADPSVIYGISHDGLVQRSSDSGGTWTASGTAPERLIDIATSASDAQTLYAATETGLLQSPDAGASWHRMTESDRPVSTAEMGPDGTLRAVQIGQGLLAWTPGADAPVQIAPVVPGGYLLMLSSTATDPLRLMALSAEGALVLSDDGGATWTVVGG